MTLLDDLDNAYIKLQSYANDPACPYQSTFSDLVTTFGQTIDNIRYLLDFLFNFLVDPKYAVFGAFDSISTKVLLVSIGNVYKDLIDGKLTDSTLNIINTLPTCDALTYEDVNQVSDAINNLNTDVNNKVNVTIGIESLLDNTIRYISKIPQLAKSLNADSTLQPYIAYKDSLLGTIANDMLQFYGDENLMINKGFYSLDENLSISSNLWSYIDQLKIT